MLKEAFDLGTRLNIKPIRVVQASQAISKNLKSIDINYFFLESIVRNNVLLNEKERNIMLTIVSKEDGWKELAFSILAGTTNARNY